MLSRAINILYFRAVWRIAFDPAHFNAIASKTALIFSVSSLVHSCVVIAINTCVQRCVHCALNRERVAIKVSMLRALSPPAFGSWIESIFTSMLLGRARAFSQGRRITSVAAVTAAVIVLHRLTA